MAKWKAAGSRAKAKNPKARGAIPCIIFLASGMILLMLLFYAILKSG
jgi:hypothetical protein